MTIIAYAGLPGQGKSYSVVENVVIPALKEKRHVAHNLVLNVAVLSVVVGFDVSPYLHQIGRDDKPADVVLKVPLGAVAIFDEVWRYWASGLKADEVPKEELCFFKEHRHRVGDDGRSTEIVLIDQDPETALPKWLRALIELTYIYRKQSLVGASNRYRCHVYSGCQSIQRPVAGARVREMHGRYKPEVFNCYVSHTQNKRLGEVGLEVAVDKRATVWSSWTVRASVLALILLPVLAWRAWAGFFGLERAAKAKPVAAAEAVRAPVTSTPGVAARVATVAPVAAAPPRSSGDWTLVGVMVWHDKQYAVVDSVNGQRRVPLTECKRDLEWSCIVDGEVVTSWSGDLHRRMEAVGYSVPLPTGTVITN